MDAGKNSHIILWIVSIVICLSTGCLPVMFVALRQSAVASYDEQTLRQRIINSWYSALPKRRLIARRLAFAESSVRILFKLIPPRWTWTPRPCSAPSLTRETPCYDEIRTACRDNPIINIEAEEEENFSWTRQGRALVLTQRLQYPIFGQKLSHESLYG